MKACCVFAVAAHSAIFPGARRVFISTGHVGLVSPRFGRLIPRRSDTAVETANNKRGVCSTASYKAGVRESRLAGQALSEPYGSCRMLDRGEATFVFSERERI